MHATVVWHFLMDRRAAQGNLASLDLEAGIEEEFTEAERELRLTEERRRNGRCPGRSMK